MATGTAIGRQPHPAERRRARRLRLQVPIFVRGMDDVYADAFLDLTKTADISAIGACLASPRALRLNQLVSLRIPAPSPSSAGLLPGASPPISARVVRSQSMGDFHLVGVEFTKPLD
ncbi:MAG TPA: PilZ domain-containing protein [Candidatus Acidoferrales bacterium]|nr:PilZ domain-containing protein [Candidatus Acidoferrales bacterium]